MTDNKKVLGTVFCLSLVKPPTPANIASALGAGGDALGKDLRRLTRSGYLEEKGGRITLTPRGRKRIRVVFIGGGFEVIHRGHLYTIDRAKSLGDVLVVSIARDSTIRRRKKRTPMANEHERLRLLSSLRQVDAAILGVRGDIYRTLEKVRPDVVALGYDQYHSEAEIAREARRRRMKLRVVRLDSPYPEIKTSSLLKET
jgi:cytidyltransferase-like protein